TAGSSLGAGRRPGPGAGRGSPAGTARRSAARPPRSTPSGRRRAARGRAARHQSWAPLRMRRAPWSSRASVREPEAGRAARAEGDRGGERDAVRAAHVVHEAAEPRPDGPGQPVAEIEHAVDDAEAPTAEPLAGDRGDDRPPRAEAEPEQDRED